MQVFWRLMTIARPRCGSPGAPVSDAGMESPSTTVLRNSCPPARPGNARRATVNIRCTDLTKDFIGDRIEPGFRIARLARAEFARRIHGAGSARAFDVGKQAVLRPVTAGDRAA